MGISHKIIARILARIFSRIFARVLYGMVYVAGGILATPTGLADVPASYPPLASYAILSAPSSQASLIYVNDDASQRNETVGVGVGGSLGFVARNHALIIADDDRLLRAMRLLRLEGLSRYSVALGELAGKRRELPPRVVNELALAYFALEDCKAVRGLLDEFVEDRQAASDGVASDEGERQGRVILHGCEVRERVRFAWEATARVGYSSNLANTRDRYFVTIEKGSEVAEIIRILGLPPSFANEIYIGRDKVDGWFVEERLAVSLKRQVNKRHNRIDLSGFYRSTRPSGYDSKGAQFSFGWHAPLGQARAVLFENRLTASAFSQGQGRDDVSLIQHAWRLRQSLYFRPSEATTAVIQWHGRTSYNPRITSSVADDYGTRVTFIGDPDAQSSIFKHWRFGVFRTWRYVFPGQNSDTLFGMDNEVHVGDKRHYVFRFGRGHEKSAEPSSNRVNPHTIRRDYAGLGYYPSGADSPFSIDVQWNHNVYPENHQDDLQLVFSYNWQ